MPHARRVESARNPLVKEVAKLKQRRERERTGLMLIEGVREVRSALSADLPVRRLLLCPDMQSGGGPEGEALRRIAEQRGAEIVLLSTQAFARVSLRQGPDGVAAVAAAYGRDLSALLLPTEPLLLVLQGLEKPGNIGALLRTADAVGVDAVVLTGAGTDVTNPNVIRASMGSAFAVPVAVAPDDEALAWLRQRSLRLVAASPGADRTHWDADYHGATAVVLGAEHEGLPEPWLAAAQARVRIPMHGRAADSLNVAVAGAVLLYEAARQRRH
jgi:RNA methyltransferase, TrmH family